MGKGIFTKDIYVFEKNAETILGAEIDVLRDYILKYYMRGMDKYKIKFNEFVKIIQEWVNYESQAKGNNFDAQTDQGKSQASSVAKALAPSEDSDNDSPDSNAKEAFK